MTGSPIDSRETRVLVLGTGALGSLVAARIARSGAADVTVAGTWSDALEAMTRDGVTVLESGSEWNVPVRAVRLAEVDDAIADVVLVVVKSHQTNRVAPHAAAAACDTGVVVTMQNGLGNGEVLASHAGPSRVATAVTSMGSTLLNPARVADGGPGYTAIGSDHVPRARIVSVGKMLHGAGVPTDVVDDIQPLVWRKLAVNAAINPLSALLGVRNGRLLEAEWARHAMTRAALEVGLVAKTVGVDIEGDPAEHAFDVARRTAHNRSSMLQDVERGRPTEIDAITGQVVLLGGERGVPTPVNRALLDMVRADEPDGDHGDGRTATESESWARVRRELERRIRDGAHVRVPMATESN